jgi:hypothetical protein
MAKKVEPKSTNGNGKGRLQIFVAGFAVEGGDSVLSDGFKVIKDITDSMRQAGVLAPAPRVKGALGAASAPKLGSTAAVGEIEPSEEEALEIPEQEGPEEEEVEAGEEAADAGDGNWKPKRVIKPKGPKLLSTPNLTEASVALADFIKQKNPTDMMDKYAVVAVWYKEQFNIEDMDIDRIFSAFKLLGVESQLPTDVSKPLKNLTYNRKWFDKHKTKPSIFTLNWIGESEVGKMGATAGATTA